MRFFVFDMSELAAVFDTGVAMSLRDGVWGPPDGSRALEVLGDDRAIELSDADAKRWLELRGAEHTVLALQA
jgi:hypothetical protein